MRDILPEVQRWIEQGKPIAVATVIETWGSSPRGVGARMAFTTDGDIAGSVSGGCVEAAVLEAGFEMLKGGSPQLLHFSVADETAWSVGLTCGGSLDVFVSRLDEKLLPALRDALSTEQPVVMITAIRGLDEFVGNALLTSANGAATGSLGKAWHTRAAELASEGFISLRSGRIGLDQGIEVFRDVFLPQPTLVMVGGVHVAKALFPIAKALSWRTVMIDPRKVWAKADRFHDVDRLLHVWPEDAFQQLELTASSAVVTLTHDPKLDDAALMIALHSPAFYVGALGSKSSHSKRVARLRQAGMQDEELHRLHAPIGLPIGAQSPEEIALAIMAEIISEYRRPMYAPNGSGAALAPATPVANGAPS